MDDIDRRIIRMLRANGRISNADLADAVGLSASACHRRMGLLESSGVIRGYTALIEAPSEEGGLVVLTQFTLDRQTEEFLNQFEAAVRRCPEVQDCYLMTGIADYLVKLKVKDAADYERLHKEVLSRLPGVSRLQSSFAIRTVVSPASSI
ncbi:MULTISPECIES: Lrp/AsnC family transcriptional regulator [Methylorubrum]|uniref:Lrp/AsnC family transcriptional regulator n=1 Tax=Methylorubrum TaxID=2282523 RepID=UPI001AE857A7|nr:MULTISPECIES: Lrp/AsnC family transcriptional regulator [Methylorubrum]MCJ2027972.1 Lrp/AsnC family transcriptional regulator [Methylobacterium sp. J-043]MDF9861177.1 DNA-binding Lrp family transcriptional regulator [Methylorubrum pseudosasae]MDH6639992.1 DNA-binding Lrp family transcriptional regulator [Methylobacterium sp. SuP10 SLI 274]MCP1535624.1 DNA-binding Lrp family transcriptional regulator [Methylorubrum extorquens]MCP1551516.1 DNA-binding Lrp family transcriptional regulator [Met